MALCISSTNAIYTNDIYILLWWSRRVWLNPFM